MLYNYVNTSKFWASLDDDERAYGLENHCEVSDDSDSFINDQFILC